jgi:hypothetical protein
MFDENHAPMLHRYKLYLQMDQNKISHDPRHPGVPSGASKMIFSLCYVRRKSCTYLASRLALSQNRPKRASTPPRSSIGCVQNDFSSYDTFSRKLCTYLAPTLTPSPNGQRQYSTWATSARSIIGCIQYDFWPYGTFGNNRAPILLWH